VSGFTIDEAVIPATIADDADGAFAAMIAVWNACDFASYGIHDVDQTPAEAVPHMTDPHHPHRMFAARVDGRIVGMAINDYIAEEPATAWMTVRVHPDFQGLGIGRALAATIEDLARGMGQTRLISYVPSGERPGEGRGERLVPPTGFGSVPIDNREVRFALAQGWTLEQVERASRIPLPIDSEALASLRAEAESRAVGYRVLTWEGALPPEWHADLAVLETRMSTDAPSAGLHEPEDVYTAERIAEQEARVLIPGQQLFTSAVLHEASGHLVGYTRLRAPDDRDRAVGQWATLVLREHRGHRLGMLLKVANLQFLQEHAPGHPSVVTWNAEENRYMLGVNEAVGFVPIGQEGAWGKTLV
jgi:GNAT superfamily N-acetyltransferase